MEEVRTYKRGKRSSVGKESQCCSVAEEELVLGSSTFATVGKSLSEGGGEHAEPLQQSPHPSVARSITFLETSEPSSKVTVPVLEHNVVNASFGDGASDEHEAQAACTRRETTTGVQRYLYGKFSKSHFGSGDLPGYVNGSDGEGSGDVLIPVPVNVHRMEDRGLDVGERAHRRLPLSPLSVVPATPIAGPENLHTEAERKMKEYLGQMSPTAVAKFLNQASQHLKRKSSDGVEKRTGSTKPSVVAKKKKRPCVHHIHENIGTGVSEEHLWRLEELDTRIKELEEEKVRVVGGHGRVIFSNPRESAQGPGLKKQTMKCNPPHQRTTKSQGYSGSALSTDSCPPRSSSVSFSDPHSLGMWDLVRDVPPVELNEDFEPVGMYWEHMSIFAFERAKMIFQWHVEWRKQDQKMKLRFIHRLKSIYPGDWDSKYVLAQIGNNLRERRIRLRRRFQTCHKKDSVPVPIGCSMESWNAIYNSLDDPKYQEKSEKCRSGKEGPSGKAQFTHKLGPGGVKKLIVKFVDEFGRPPTNEDITFAKRNGVSQLIERTYKKLDSGKINTEALVTLPCPSNALDASKKSPVEAFRNLEKYLEEKSEAWSKSDTSSSNFDGSSSGDDTA